MGEADGDGGEGPPGWLRDLAAAAAVMEVPPVARPPAVGGRRSAILVLFGDGPDGPDLLYIQRNEGLRRHAGQPAFPGGKIEDDDDGPVGAALREAAEETGVDPAGVEVLTTLPELFIARSQFRVVPVLAWWRTPSAVRPVDIGEVAAVERISVADLADPGNRVMLQFPGGHSGPGFRMGGMLIWGFTGMLTDRLLALGGFERPWDSNVISELPQNAAQPGKLPLHSPIIRGVLVVPGRELPVGKLKFAFVPLLCFAAAACGAVLPAASSASTRSVTATSASARPAAAAASTEKAPAAAKSKFVVLGAQHPVVGVNLYAVKNYTAAETRAYGIRMLSYIKNVLHAGAVDIVWNLYAPSYTANSVERTSATLTPANVAILTQQAKADHLLVAYRPIMFVLNAVNNWEGMIKPSHPEKWFQSYYNYNVPYLRLAQKYYVSEYVAGTEMDGVSRSAYWKTFLSKSAKIYKGQLSYADHEYLYFPPRTQYPPTKLQGLDDYEPLALPATASLAKVTAAYEKYLTTAPTALLHRTLIDETGIEARAGAYQEPSFLYITGTLDPVIQANWFTAACRAVKRFHMRGVFFWKVDLADNPIEHPATSLSTFEGRVGATAIGKCAAIIAS